MFVFLWFLYGFFLPWDSAPLNSPPFGEYLPNIRKSKKFTEQIHFPGWWWCFVSWEDCGNVCQEVSWLSWLEKNHWSKLLEILAHINIGWKITHPTDLIKWSLRKWPCLPASRGKTPWDNLDLLKPDEFWLLIDVTSPFNHHLCKNWCTFSNHLDIAWIYAWSARFWVQIPDRVFFRIPDPYGWSRRGF